MNMNGLDYRDYFLQPSDVSQRRYEALRAVFVEQQSLKNVAGRFDVSYGTVRNWVSEFRRGCDAGQAPPFFTSSRGRPAASQRDDEEPEIQTADVRALSLETGRRLLTRHAGIFLFLPLLAKLRFDRLVTKAGYPGSKMVPAANALFSLLTLKLIDKERLSHIDDFNCDEALGLFAGLNILPKKSFATDYSYRTTRDQQQELLKGWVKKLSPVLFPEAGSFSLDFHAIGHRGEEADLENHYQPMRGQAGPSVLTFFAMEQKSRVLCYSNANLIRSQQPGEVLRFVEFWRKLMGRNPEWLYFDSKLTTYAELSKIARKKNVFFVTIDGNALVK